MNIRMEGDAQEKLLSLTTDPIQSAVKNVFIRGSVVRYVHLPPSAVDIPLLEDATRRGEFYFPPPSLRPFRLFHFDPFPCPFFIVGTPAGDYAAPPMTPPERCFR